MSDDHDGQDGFIRGFNDIPDDSQLRSMPYIQLCDLLSSCDAGTTKFMVVEAEKRRRDALSAEGQNVVAQVGKEPSENPTTDHWCKKPTPIIFWGVVTGFIVLVLLGKHRSLCLNLRLRLSHQPCNALLDLLRRRVCDD